MFLGHPKKYPIYHCPFLCGKNKQTFRNLKLNPKPKSTPQAFKLSLSHSIAIVLMQQYATAVRTHLRIICFADALSSMCNLAWMAAGLSRLPEARSGQVRPGKAR